MIYATENPRAKLRAWFIVTRRAIHFIQRP